MAGKKKHSALLIILAVILILVLAILIGGYIAVAMFFKTHYFPQTTINGYGASLGTAEALEEKIRADAEDYVLAVHDREDRVTYINGENIRYRYESEGDAARILADQDEMMWIREIQQDHTYTVEVPMAYDDDKLVELVTAMPCFDEENITEPKDAYLEYKDGEGYVIIPEEAGSKPIQEQILMDIRQAIENRETVLKLGDDDYAKPNVTADDPKLQEKFEVSNRYRNMTVTYEIEGYEQVLDGSTILSWIKINDDLSVTVNEDMLAAYAQTLASTYNTYADEREFKTSGGDTITIGGGDYGWIVDKKAEAAQLKADIEAGESVTREPCYEQRAFIGGKDDIGSTYIEIDYTNQHMYYYVDGSLKLDSDIVSGNVTVGNGSPDGVFKVIDRKTDYTLYGEDYESDVKYFMPFAYNVGLHDADWRSSFGGDIYKSDGSHGCVNLPFETAEALFGTVELGTPVVAYYLEDVELTSNNAKVSNAYSYTSK